MREQLKVLLIEDNPGDALLVTHRLGASATLACTVVHVERLGDGLARLAVEPFDVILTDLDLPDSDTDQTVGTLQSAHASTPMVVMTGTTDERVAFDALTAGAQDYLIKGMIETTVLVRSLRFAIERHRTLARLKDLDRLKTEFVATVSHEMRTPIAIIREYMSVVREELAGPLNGQQKEFLDSGLRNCDRLGNLVGDMLDFSSIEAGKLRLKRAAVCASELLSQCHADFLPGCQSREQQLDLELPDDLPLVLCDEDRVRQVLINLIGNARKFTPPGGHIAIRAAVEAESVWLEVEDDGPGLSETEQQRIFDAFRQVNRTDAPGAQGTGLGLTISKNIVELHGGTIEVDSVPGEGSRFRFPLPVCEEGAELGAFVEDKVRLARSRGALQPQSLVLFAVDAAPDAAIDQSERRRLLEWAQATGQDVFRDAADEGILIESRGLVAFMLETDEAGCRLAVDRYARSAAASSELGQLAVGFVPIEDSCEAERSIARAMSRLAPFPDSTQRAARLLVVDDDQDILDNITEVLAGSSLELEVTTAASGYEACIRFGALRPDLVILDIELGDIDAERVLASMQASSPDWSPIFITVSGHTRRIERMLELGCEAALAKPFQPDELLTMVSELLEADRDRTRGLAHA